MLVHPTRYLRQTPPSMSLPGAPATAAVAPAPRVPADSASITFRAGEGPQEHDVTQTLYWDRVKVKVAGLQPQTQVTLRAVMPAWPGATYESSAAFVADDQGNVDVAAQKPLSGTYQEADADGMFWSMVARQSKPGETLPWNTVRFTVEAANQTLAQADLTRTALAPGVTATTVRDNGLVGTLFLPPGKGPFPTLITFGGSEGGITTGEDIASHHAARGYAALALAYFKGSEKNLPDTIPDYLTNVPTEYFQKAIDYLQTRPEVDSNRIGVMGGSRGGELALLLGSIMPQLHAVVALVPSHVVWGGIGADPNADVPAWTTNGQPLPRVPMAADAVPESFVIPDGPLAGQTAYNETPASLTCLEEATPDQLAAATIQVEKTNGPILMIGGQDDQLWPSALMATQAMDRLQAQQHPYADELHTYPAAGHFAGLWPGFPTTLLYAVLSDTILNLGGTAEGTAKAQRDAMSKIDSFVDAAFTDSAPKAQAA